jgi:hypothetical protein
MSAPTGKARGFDRGSGLAPRQAGAIAQLAAEPTAISLRIPVSLLEQMKIAAHKRDVP